MKNQNGKVIAIVITIIIILLLAAGGVGAYIYFKTDLLKTPKELFSKYSEQSVSTLEMEESEKTLASIKEIIKGKYETNTSVTIEGKNILTIMLNDFKLNSTGIADVQEEKFKQDIELLYKKDDLIKLSILGEKDKFGIKDAEVLQKYLTIENRDLDKLLANFGVETAGVIPSKINLDEINSELPQMNLDVDKYINIIKDGVKNGRYSALKNQEIEFSGSNVKANGYVLSLNETEVSSILKNIIEVLKNDEELINYVMEYCQGQFTKKQFDTELENIMAQLSNEQSKEELIKIAVYENSGKTIRIEAEILGKNAVSTKFTYDIINENEILLTLKSEDVKIEINFKKEITNGVAKYIASIKQDGTKMFEFTIQIDNTKTDIVETKISFEIIGLIEIKLNNEIKKVKTVSIPKLSTKNSEVINDYTQEQLQELVINLIPEFETKYSEKFENVAKNFEMLFETMNQ